MKEIKVNEYWLKLFQQVETAVEDFVVLFDFWKAGDATMLFCKLKILSLKVL